MSVKKYIFNCFLLLIPIFIWNLIFYDQLPAAYGSEIFWKNIPTYISYPENLFRIIVLSTPILMSLSLKSRQQKMGFIIYSIGTIIYFLSWLVLILHPNSNWSQSLLGFMAPAYTTIIWLIGIGILGHKTFIRIPKASLIYIILACVFVVFHALHTYTVFERL